MLTKLAVRQAIRQLKMNVFHLLSLTIIFMVTFVMATFTIDKSLTDNLTSAISSGIVESIGGMGSIFKVFLCAIAIINVFFLSYIFRLRMHQNSKTYALYRLLGLRTRDLFILYLFEVITLIIGASILGGLFGIGAIRVSKIFLLSLGTVLEPTVAFNFSFPSYGVTILIFAADMFMAMLFSFLVVARADIILLFKRDELVQKVSKLTPLYFIISIAVFIAIPNFAKMGSNTNEFFLNFGISVLLSVIGMYFLYKSAISVIFGIRKKLSLHKRHGSEFITGQFFFSQLNKSAVMMTIISFFLIVVFLFSFINATFVGEKDFDKSYGADFSMSQSTEKDRQEVRKWLSDKNIETYATDMEYVQVMLDENGKVLSGNEIENKLTQSRTDDSEYVKFDELKYQNIFFITEKTFEANKEQFKKVNREVPKGIERAYKAQTGKKIKQIGGAQLTAAEMQKIGLSPEDLGTLPTDLSRDEQIELRSPFFIELPVFGAGVKAMSIRGQSPIVIVPETQYNTLKEKGRVNKQVVFNTPHINVQQYRKLYEETSLKNYAGVTTNGKMTVLLVNVEMQSPIRFSLGIMFVQVMFYILILIMYRLSEMLQKQYRIFETLHIVGASDATIIGSICLQVFATLLFPIAVSFYIAWIAVSNVFSAFYTSSQIWEYLTSNLPLIVTLFVGLAVFFTVYQSYVIKRRQIN